MPWARGHRKWRSPAQGRFQVPCHGKHPPLSLLGHSRCPDPGWGAGIPSHTSRDGQAIISQAFLAPDRSHAHSRSQSPKKEGLEAPPQRGHSSPPDRKGPVGIEAEPGLPATVAGPWC